MEDQQGASFVARRHGAEDSVPPLSGTAVKEVVLDHCPSCSGLWFDENELGCPRCRERMKRVESEDKKGLYVDACPICEGAWGGELVPWNRVPSHKFAALDQPGLHGALALDLKRATRFQDVLVA